MRHRDPDGGSYALRAPAATRVQVGPFRTRDAGAAPDHRHGHDPPNLVLGGVLGVPEGRGRERRAALDLGLLLRRVRNQPRWSRTAPPRGIASPLRAPGRQTRACNCPLTASTHQPGRAYTIHPRSRGSSRSRHRRRRSALHSPPTNLLASPGLGDLLPRRLAEFAPAVSRSGTEAVSRARASRARRRSIGVVPSSGAATPASRSEQGRYEAQV